MLDFLADLLSALPLFLLLALATALIGYVFAGSGGAAAGAVIGLVLGLWLDFSERAIAKRLRLPVGLVVGALALLAVTQLFRR